MEFWRQLAITPFSFPRFIAGSGAECVGQISVVTVAAPAFSATDPLHLSFLLDSSELGKHFDADDVIFSFERQWKTDNAYFKVTSDNHSYYSDMGFDTLLKDLTKRQNQTRLLGRDFVFFGTWGGPSHVEIVDYHA